MKLKHVIVSFVAGAITATALTAGASTAYEKFTAIARPDYKLVVDGESAKLNNSPVTINGSSYLPVREVATILDADVSFNSGIINITTKEESEGDIVTNGSTTTPNDVLKIDGFLTLKEVSEIENIKVVLGHSEGMSNVLSITLGDKVIKVFDFIPPKDAPEAVYKTSIGKDLQVKYHKGVTYIDEAFLKDQGIIG